MAAKQNYYAVDGDILLAIADGNECALGLVDFFSAMTYHPVVTLSVLTHLQDVKYNAPEWKSQAERALSQLPLLGVLEPSLTETEQDLAEMAAEELVSQGVVSSFSFAFAIAEASLFGAKVFITAQHDECMAVDDKQLGFILQSRGMNNIAVLSPEIIASYEENRAKKTAPQSK